MNDKWRFGSKGIFIGVPKTPTRRAPFLAFPFFVLFFFVMLWNPGIPPDVLQEYQDPEKPKELLQPSTSTSTHPLLSPYLLHRTLNFQPTLNSDDFNILIDHTEFDFIINHFPCNKSSYVKQFNSNLVLLVLVHSNPSNWEKRQVIRDTWGSWARIPVQGARIHLLFLLGEVSSKSLQESIFEEDLRHKDIIQGRFLDSYRNLTYKHVMGLKWATYFCPEATYVLKTDDDIFVNTPALVQFLTLPRPDNMLKPSITRFILCNRIDNARVKRSHRSKWYVRPEEYPKKEYPSYCMGCAVLYSFDVVQLLYHRAQAMPYFWVDDVHVTGILAHQLNITQTHVGDLTLKDNQANDVISISLGKRKKPWMKWWWSSSSLPWGDGKDTFLFGTELESSVIKDLWRIVQAEHKH